MVVNGLESSQCDREVRQLQSIAPDGGGQM